MKKIKITKKRIIWGTIIILIVVIASYFIFFKKEPLLYDFIIVKNGDLIQEVSVTGRVKPSNEVSLAFENSGKIVWVNAKVGKKVYDGTALAMIDNSELQAKLAQANASVKIQEAKLEELQKGTRDEEIALQEAKVTKAEISLAETEKNLTDKLQDAYTKSDNAVRNNIDQFFSNPTSHNPQISFVISDESLRSDIEWGRLVIENTLTTWKSSLDRTFDVEKANESLDEIMSFLEDVALAVNALKSSTNLTQTTIDGYKADVSTARTSINTAIANTATADEAFKIAGSDLVVAQNELILKQAGTLEEQIQAQEAKVDEAKANAENFEAQLAKTTLYSPINGTVTIQDAKVGEIVSANASVVSIISEAKLEIEVNIPEADIAKISLGDLSKVTLDAYGDDVMFEAKVTAIDPAETMIEGVATYKTTLHFVEDDDRIRSGMTANLDISTDERTSVIAIPQRAVIFKNGSKISRVLDDKDQIQEIDVQTGLRGSDGRIEITGGIREGDRVIIFLKEE